MRIEKFQLRGNNSVCAEVFQLLRGRAPAQLRGNVDFCYPFTHALFLFSSSSSSNYYSSLVCLFILFES
jgi:ABC-type uncharacterized transport system permease subunit